MALSDDLREELAAISPSNECDRLAELSGLFHVAGRAHLRGRGSVDVHLDVSIPNFVVQEYSRVDEQWAAAFPGTLQRQGGYLPVPEAPGLGVRIDDARLTELGRPRLARSGRR